MLMSPAADAIGFTNDGTLVSARAAVELSRLTNRLMSTGADVAELADGTVLVSCAVRGNAVDTLAHIASTGLDFQRSTASWRVALATGRADATGRSQLGAVIDRAASLLRRSPQSYGDGTAPTLDPESQPTLVGDSILVDDVTATLLSVRFEIEQHGAATLAKETRPKPGMGTLLGKRTPLVGRERELALLDASLAECCSDSVARTVVVTGPAGIGKSRLTHEFLCRAGDRVRVLTGRNSTRVTH
jgi:hypothetical protein